jgi:multidrug efflux system membrane fusion protein
MQTRLTSRLIPLFPTSAVLACALALLGCSNTEPAVVSVRPAIVVQPTASTQQYAAYAGEIRARHEPALAFRVAGKISQRLVDVGDRVRKDQPLAELEPQDLGLQMESSRAQRAAAQSELELARSEHERQQALKDRGLASASALDTATARLESAQARLEAAQAQFQVSRNQAGYAVLRAPADGVIAQRMAEAGQVVAAGQAVFVLAEDGEREVLIALPEQTVSSVAIGTRVQVQLWSQREQALSGRIRELAPSADAASRTYAARVTIEDSNAAVELGQSARVFFDRGEASALRLPLAAVSADAGAPYVLRFDPATGTVGRVAVTLGAYAETSVPVLTGLSSTDWVVAGGVHLLRDGQAVRPVDRENRPLQLVAAQ